MSDQNLLTYWFIYFCHKYSASVGLILWIPPPYKETGWKPCWCCWTPISSVMFRTTIVLRLWRTEDKEATRLGATVLTVRDATPDQKWEVTATCVMKQRSVNSVNIPVYWWTKYISYFSSATYILLCSISSDSYNFTQWDDLSEFRLNSATINQRWNIYLFARCLWFICTMNECDSYDLEMRITILQFVLTRWLIILCVGWIWIW